MRNIKDDLRKGPQQLISDLRTKESQSSRGQKESVRSELDPAQRLSSVPLEVKQAVMRLWDRMIAIKGQSWLTQWGDTDSEHFITWCEVCKDLSPEQIKSGFTRFMDSTDEFLDCKKFRQLCLGRTEHDNNWEAYQVSKPALPKIFDKAASERGRNKFIEEMKNKTR